MVLPDTNQLKEHVDAHHVTNLGWVRGQDHTNNEQTQSVMV